MGKPFRTLLWREIRRFERIYSQTLLTPLINACLYLLIFGVSLGSRLDLPPGQSYLVFLVPGLVMMAALNNAFLNSSASLVIAKYHGDLQDLRTTPLTSHDIVWGISLASALRGLAVAFAVALVGELFCLLYLHDSLPLAYPLIALFFLACSSITFGQLGLAIGFISRNFDQMNSVSSFLLLPLIYLGGVFFSLNGLPQFWQEISRLNPLLYLINGLRYGVLGHADVPILLAVGVSLACLGLSSLLAYRTVRSSDHYQL